MLSRETFTVGDHLLATENEIVETTGKAKPDGLIRARWNGRSKYVRMIYRRHRTLKKFNSSDQSTSGMALPSFTRRKPRVL
jgi:hypothetical protein